MPDLIHEALLFRGPKNRGQQVAEPIASRPNRKALNVSDNGDMTVNEEKTEEKETAGTRSRTKAKTKANPAR